MNELRINIAALARRLYAKEVTFSEFMEGAPEQDEDELIDELVDLIIHEPKKGGIFGMKESEHKEYLNEVFQVIEKLENEAT